MNFPEVSFADSTGSCTLSCVVPRFDAWTPAQMDYTKDAVATSLGSGLTYTFVFRRDECATFQISHLRQTSLNAALRFITWAGNGGSFHIKTFDLASHEFNCVVWPGKTMTLDFSDRQNNEYTLTVAAKNTGSGSMAVTY